MDTVTRVGWASALFAVVMAIVLAISHAAWPDVQTDGSRVRASINERVVLPRDASSTCDQIRGADLDFNDVHLAIEGMDTGLRAVGCEDEPKPTLSFVLRHIQPNGLTAQADEAVWYAILGHPLQTLGKERVLSYDLRLMRDGEPTVRLSHRQPAIVLQIFQWWSPAALLLVLYVWALIVYLAKNSALIRDPAPRETPLVQRTFSLAKAQMAWWFSIVFVSIVFLWLVTGEAPSISGQALAFLGLSGVTTMASAGISAGRVSTAGRSGEFFVDLLSDEHGVAIHRLQMLVMTITLGLIFVFDVATKLIMPEFDASMLALMGLSSATYVGLKIPEQKAGAMPG